MLRSFSRSLAVPKYPGRSLTRSLQLAAYSRATPRSLSAAPSPLASLVVRSSSAPSSLASTPRSLATMADAAPDGSAKLIDGTATAAYAPSRPPPCQVSLLPTSPRLPPLA